MQVTELNTLMHKAKKERWGASLKLICQRPLLDSV